MRMDRCRGHVMFWRGKKIWYLGVFIMSSMQKPRLVVLSGAGISAESGIPTFRASDGLWENHRIEDVASPAGWNRNPQLVLDFYNQRRRHALGALPNAGHQVLAELEEDFDVHIITQNIDDLHERGGSTHVLHLHGEIFKVRSTLDPALIYHIDDIDPKGWELKWGDRCSKGSQLRPHIVWFGEDVPAIRQAAALAATADLFVVTGTSLVVYPAAGLVHEIGSHVPLYVVDPNTPDLSGVNRQRLRVINAPASIGLRQMADELRAMRRQGHLPKNS